MFGVDGACEGICQTRAKRRNCELSSVRSSHVTRVLWFVGALRRVGPTSSQLWQSGVGFAGVYYVRGFSFHCVHSVLALLPDCSACL